MFGSRHSDDIVAAKSLADGTPWAAGSSRDAAKAMTEKRLVGGLHGGAYRSSSSSYSSAKFPRRLDCGQCVPDSGHVRCGESSLDFVAARWQDVARRHARSGED
jgi:hypothetical protein